jgi:hypothetical protein
MPKKHHTGTKGQSMADKEPHRDKRTVYCRQRTTQGQNDNIWPTKQHTGTKGQYMAEKAPHRDKLWPTKNHIGTKEQSMADKAPHRDKRTICCRQSTT